MTTTVFRVDVDERIMREASQILASDGITVTEAFNLMMNYIVVEKRTPYFACLEPNEETLAAIADTVQGNLVTVGSVAQLMDELNEDD